MKLILGIVGALATAQVEALGLFRYTGVSWFQCAWPSSMDSVDYTQLEGTWFQAYASYGTDNYGCVYQTIRNTDDGNSNKFKLDVNWTAYSASVTDRLNRGTFAKTYSLSGSSNGLLRYAKRFSSDPIYGRIVKTDYSTYMLYNYCAQKNLDTYTREYWEILTPTGTITDSLLNSLKADISALDSGFDTSTLKQTRQSDCQVVNSWYLF